MMEYITFLSSLVLIGASMAGYRRKSELPYVFWIISGLAFLVISAALIAMGLDALKLSVTPYLGSIYPAFMALGLIALRYRWRYYLAFIVLMLLLFALTSSNVFRIGLHSVSGIVVVLLPLLYLARKQAGPNILPFTFGGITISVGGVALASITAGRPILPLDLVIQLLHPLLFISAFLLALGVYLVGEEG
jgi:hypothetical protein